MNSKSIILSALALVTFSTAFAQSKTSAKADEIFKTYRFGLFLGPSFNSMKPIASTADNFNVSKNGSKVGLTFGLSADYNFNERYTGFTGIGLDWRGGGINAQLPDTATSQAKYVRGANVKYNLQYLTIPVGLKMKAAQIDKIKIQAIAGFDLGILLSQKGDYTYKLTTSTGGVYDTKTFTKSKLGGNATVNPINIGWSIGAGGEYDLNGKNAVTFQILYRNGFVDVTLPKTNDDGNKFSDGNVRSNSIVLKVGYTF